MTKTIATKFLFVLLLCLVMPFSLSLSAQRMGGTKDRSGSATVTIPLISNGNDQNTNNGTTFYRLVGLTSAGGTEPGARQTLPFNGTLSKFCIVTRTAQPAGGSDVFTVRDTTAASSAGSLTITLAANQAAGTYCDNANTDSIVGGHSYTIQSVNSAGGAGAILDDIILVYSY